MSRDAEPAVRVATPGDIAGVIELCAAALPDERILLDEIEELLFAPARPARHLVDQIDSVVFTIEASDGAPAAPVAALAATLSSVAGEPRAHVQLVAVHPEHRRRGHARLLVAAARTWAAEHGSASLTVGGAAPFYLFTGIDSRWTAALCTFEALGFTRIMTELDLVCPTRRSGSASVAPAAPQAPLRVESVRDEAGAAALAAFADTHWPQWSAEFERAADAGTVFVATEPDGDAVLGAAAHSVGRLGVIGPVAVAPDLHGRGVGSAVMAAVCAELSVAGFDQAEIAWTSTVRFYSIACDAVVGRTSVILSADLTG